MQYSYTLPADYDMSIIRQRIETKGKLMNEFPHLVFKAFTYASRGQACDYSRENLYAPFYLWKDNAGINRFLCSDGFAALVQSFGWPLVRIWLVLEYDLPENLTSAEWATREGIPISPYTALEQLRLAETERLMTDITTKGAVGAVTAFDPTSWTLVRYRLWETCPQTANDKNTQIYRVGYLATSTTVPEIDKPDG